MNYKPIVIVAGEPNSIFLEIFFKTLKNNKFTKPIVVPGGFLILQINDIKNIRVEVDIEKELKKLKDYEKNNQLNQYSKIYFNKVKKDLEISEL